LKEREGHFRFKILNLETPPLSSPSRGRIKEVDKEV